MYLKIWNELLKVAPWKNVFLNFVIKINNLQIQPFLPNVSILYPLETIEDLRFSDVLRGDKRGNTGAQCLLLGKNRWNYKLFIWMS